MTTNAMHGNTYAIGVGRRYSQPLPHTPWSLAYMRIGIALMVAGVAELLTVAAAASGHAWPSWLTLVLVAQAATMTVCGVVFTVASRMMRLAAKRDAEVDRDMTSILSRQQALAEAVDSVCALVQRVLAREDAVGELAAGIQDQIDTARDNAIKRFEALQDELAEVRKLMRQCLGALRTRAAKQQNGNGGKRQDERGGDAELSSAEKRAAAEAFVERLNGIDSGHHGHNGLRIVPPPDRPTRN